MSDTIYQIRCRGKASEAPSASAYGLECAQDYRNKAPPLATGAHQGWGYTMNPRYSALVYRTPGRVIVAIVEAR